MKKTVLVTGASSAIGASLIEAFAKNSYNVVIHYYKNLGKAKALHEHIKKNYEVDSLLVQADIIKEDDVIKMMEQIKEKFSSLDVVVHNAAFEQDCSFMEKTFDEFMYTLKVNVGGPFLVSKYAYKLMRQGTMVFISSLDATFTYRALAADYCASKAGVNSLCQTLSQAMPSIKCVALMLPWIETPAVLEMDCQYLKEEMLKNGQKKLVSTDSVAKKVIDIINDESINTGMIMEMNYDE